MIVWFHRFHNYVPFQRQRYQAISGGIDWYNAVVVLYPVGGLDAVAKFTPWQCGLTIEELKEEVKAFNPSEDEITRILSTVEFVLHGEKLNDLQMTVSDSILDSANVQVIFYVKPANECVNKFGHRVTELRDVRIPSTETSIQEDAFEGCACLLRLVIPIGDGAFRACSSLTSLTIPKSVTQIRYKAFSGCSSLTSLTIPESVTQIGDGAFRYCTSLTSLTIPKSVTQIGDHAFTGCSSLKSLTIPDSVTQIGMYFFSLHLFDEFDHPRVTQILYKAFSGCSSLTSLEDKLKQAEEGLLLPEYRDRNLRGDSKHCVPQVFLNVSLGFCQVDNAKALKVADEEAMHHEAMKERQKWITEVAELFSKISVEKDAKLTKDDFIYHVTNSDRINTCFYHLGINTETTNTDELWELFDMDANGVIDQDEFAIGIKQFHGFARSIDLFKLRKEVREILKQVNKMFLVEPE
ncbi:unnamed protein product [Cladocopium goreaui]|uniref:Surface protein bspA-like (TvBspA-like-625) n=1 Tax=Cladocopium goreaui TaxID=2562237 RepID=A0A9P1BTL0_9DINO|nr:unnamed protein product [Cladocopium goreaui]